jgi:hypothetical protein
MELSPSFPGSCEDFILWSHQNIFVLVIMIIKGKIIEVIRLSWYKPELITLSQAFIASAQRGVPV